MHVSELFRAHPIVYSRSGDHSSREWDSYFECCKAEVTFVLVVFIVGALTLPFQQMGNVSQDYFWLWAVPSILMTPFIIWRIWTRLCSRHWSEGVFSVIHRDVYLGDLTGMKVLLYLVKAYLPILNLVCVLAGVVSVLMCRWTVSCSHVTPNRP